MTVALQLFDSGTLTVAAGAMGGAEPMTVPVPFYLIDHPEGRVLFDGGNPLECARDPAAHWGPLARVFRVEMTEEQHVLARLRAIGVEPSSIRYVLQSHLHMDHTGALGHFPDAEVLVHGAELQAAREADPAKPTGYVRADFERPGIRWREVDGELDVYGDGTIRTIFTPGHSAGHLSLLLELPETGPVLLTADAAYLRAQYDGRLPPPALFSREDADESLERLRTIERDTGAMVVVGHDPREWATLRRAPERYA